MPSVGLVGGRGYAGEETLNYLARHPSLEIACVASASLAGKPVGDAVPALAGSGLFFQPPEPEVLRSQNVDVWILALGNGEAAPFVKALSSPSARIVDLSADYRCHPNWQYGLSEVMAGAIRSSRWIANPGCYATGMQLALWPVRDQLASPAVAFGVSGYSGAGRRPSPRNDADRLRENLMPYHLESHQHEVEVQYHLGTAVRLLPHVAAFFRGISLTIRFETRESLSLEQMLQRYAEIYANEPLVRVGEAIPEIADVRDTGRCHIGGFALDPVEPNHWIVVATLDNLGKGAATQAIQNVNLMLGYEHYLGVDGG